MKPTKMTTKDLDYCWLTAAALSRNKTSTALERGLGETHGRHRNHALRQDRTHEHPNHLWRCGDWSHATGSRRLVLATVREFGINHIDTAAMYGAQYGLKTGLVERMMGGASIINVEKIENYPGFPEGISGAELGPSVQEQAMNAGAEFIMADVARISREADFTMVASDAGGYRTKALIVAAGSTLRQLGIPGEQELFGRGVSQCATCDGPMFMGEVVGVVGGGE